MGRTNSCGRFNNDLVVTKSYGRSLFILKSCLFFCYICQIFIQSIILKESHETIRSKSSITNNSFEKVLIRLRFHCGLFFLSFVLRRHNL